MSLSAVVDRIRAGRRFLAVPHRRPDADALGSALGLAAVLRDNGKEADVYVPGSVPRSLAFLVEGSPVVSSLDPAARYDACFVLDTASPELLPELPEAARRGPLIVLDHHAVHDPFGELVLRRPQASATAELVVQLARELGHVELPRAAATPLYAALSADTGGFRYPGTTAATMRLGAELLDAGAEAWPVARQLFEAWPVGRLRLLSAIIDRMELAFDGRATLFRVSRAVMERCGADDQMVDGLVNYGRALDGVEVSALLWEWPSRQGEPATKLSLRSAGPVDVARIAAAFGGGGHRAAAGALLDVGLELASTRVLDEIGQSLP